MTIISLPISILLLYLFRLDPQQRRKSQPLSPNRSSLAGTHQKRKEFNNAI